MTVLASKVTLLDIARRRDTDGGIATAIEIAAETNDVLGDIPLVQCNDGTRHITTYRNGYPSGTWRLFNFGVQPAKSTTRQNADTTGQLEAYAEVDKALVLLEGGPEQARAWRMSEDAAFLQGMTEQYVDTFFYGDTDVNPERFLGLEPRFHSLSATNGAQIIDAGGAATLTSMWLVVYGGGNNVCGLYPKGTIGGWSMEDLGEVTLLDTASGRYQGYRTHYKWQCGLAVRDWRYVVRIANINVATLTKTGTTGADLIDLIQQALDIPPNLNGAVFYANRTIRSFLRRQVGNRGNILYTPDTVAGKPVLSIGEVPVHRVDALLNTETQVT